MEQKPSWLKVGYQAAAVDEVSRLMRTLELSTVCKEANCPNLGACFKKRTATFMILGSVCTRRCGFCAVSKGCAGAVDPGEPLRVAKAAAALGLRHVVVTSVTRDDLPDGGASHFAAVVRAVRAQNPNATVEVLIPDLLGDKNSLDLVIKAAPEIINHNLETVPALYPRVRPQADYRRSLEVLRYVKEANPKILTKTGIMAGLGETPEEVLSLMDDALAAGCDILTIGQYLRPSPSHIPLAEYVSPERFAFYEKAGRAKGFLFVASAPLVRSSYNAQEIFKLAGGMSDDLS